ncbi:MAG: polyribonucleotide nucleotidyltransferase, partial [Firmicutes bacterium]|nr:polyribonucleotide nucleotidyltransferase [Bacillota bacterium]
DAIMMVEAGADILSESIMLEGIMFAHEEIKRQVAFINKIVKKVGKKKGTFPMYEISAEINTEVRKFADKLLDKALKTHDRQERSANEDKVEADVLDEFKKKFEGKEREIKDVLYDMTKEKVRAKILKGERPDGRKLTEVRDIWCEVGVLARTHGSGVFTRGQTQALTTCTLGMLTEVQKLDNLDEETKKRYMHHYNFLPFSTGEAKPMRAPGRREIGHGALAERSLEPVLPSEEEFPYAIRTVSEILSSNGSTSQASVCGSTLALMDAGVPLKAPVAGIAMGLIKDSGKVAVLTDIQGLEDFLGDMDFKVAGTKDGITAIQMDIKIKGIDKEVLTKALEQARVGRIHILDKMLKTLPKPRTELSKYAPKIISFEIDPDKIGDVIGKGGKVINGIIDATGVTLDIEDDGTVFIATNDPDAAQKAKSMVLAIVEEVAIGNKYEGKVVRVLEFGAFVQLSPVKDGMVHISKLANKRVEKVTDVINVGDNVVVEVIKVDDRGRVDLKLVEKK